MQQKSQGPVPGTTPVIVGVGQVCQRPDDLTEALEPFRLMVEAARLAEHDSGNRGLTTAAELVVVVDGAWRYPDPARLVAEHLSASQASTALTTAGGQAPLAALNYVATEIQAGTIECALLTGGETIWSRRRLRKAGGDLTVTEQGEVSPDVTLGRGLQMYTPFEEERGVNLPIVAYPLFESAIRHRNGESHDAHRDRIGRLWARFNTVAQHNPHAWSRQALSADDIREPSPNNRMIGFPYTKAMNSNWDLDQASAIIVTSAAKATSIGVPREQWIFPHAGAEANDTASLSNRRDFHSSPAIGAAGAAVFSNLGVDVDQLAAVDLYSCFPSAVQISAEALGLSLDRELTVTGGLTFAGGPLNNYVGHSIATMATKLRDCADGSVGLVSANGGFITKHAVGLLGNTPPAAPFSRIDAQAAADAVVPVEVDDAYSGPVLVEAYTVMHERDGQRQGRCAVRTPNGQRTWGLVDDAETIDELMASEGIGRGGNLTSSGVLHLSQ